ncbi:RNA polymerase sigma factor [Flavonifractor plautii]|uniref:RNA polymerase sigma factor n=1 Tax=Flavonifractor plautii TaxID=292800 RepID=UPI000B39E803|nr:sigma-70 family RNA polymerase sigma factor [Flavonifractor plautii]MCI7151263.1 sigma-70 family RNA polymerase sigma factor [Flavonifractor plautii]MDY3699645.1 sigma-70 family RNA polymerase sigma factor [Flavonifractor plautii]OUO83097.1 RNA polymerase subunit sigma-70 [Flavonifractor plautii]HJF00578.1 sigma-70 family RNA polymerase sigma factor [Flavonifractor plautii]
MDGTRAEELVERYADAILRIGYTWLGDMDDAKDICQTVLIKLVEEGRRFPDLGQERAWVVRLSVNACKNWKKSAWFRRRAPLEEGLHLAEEAPEPEDGALLALVNGLPPKYRQVVYLRYYEEYEVHEIAALLGQSPALVSTHLARARAKLRERLEGSCCDG